MKLSTRMSSRGLERVVERLSAGAGALAWALRGVHERHVSVVVVAADDEHAARWHVRICPDYHRDGGRERAPARSDS